MRRRAERCRRRRAGDGQRAGCTGRRQLRADPAHAGASGGRQRRDDLADRVRAGRGTERVCAGCCDATDGAGAGDSSGVHLRGAARVSRPRAGAS